MTVNESDLDFMQKVQILRVAYQRETGLNIYDLSKRPSEQEIRRWHEWLRWSRDHAEKEWGPEELTMVVRWIKRQKFRTQGPLKPTRLLDDPERFAEDLALANKELRPKPAYNPGKAAVLRATGRPDQPEPPAARHVSEIDWRGWAEKAKKEIGRG